MSASMRRIQGIGVSSGIVIGRVFVIDDQTQRIPRRTVQAFQVEREEKRLDAAIQCSIDELNRIHALARDQMGESGDQAAKIFQVHIGMLGDKALIGPMRQMIQKEQVTAEFAVHATLATWIDRFRKMSNTAFTTKVNDLEDLCTRLLGHLIGEHRGRLRQISQETRGGGVDEGLVIVAPDLTPSQTAGFDRKSVRAFATELGGRTSHTSIVARALGIPAVVGGENLLGAASDGQAIIIDGERGVIILEPGEAELAEYRQRLEQQRTFKLSLDELASLPGRTLDGQTIHLLGNIEFPQEIPVLLACGGQGVGLYRTEFLFLARESEPTEEDHYQAYRECVELLAGRPITIRTVDLGADKYTQRQAEQPERNPMLGLRSIRYCLKNREMFRSQLRAILRASALGPIKIMFPLVTSVGEIRQAKWHLRDVMEELEERGVPFDRAIQIGMMVEVPSAALTADAMSREVSFFSIGTNDLTQYTLAVDRTNERVAGMFNPAHPAVIRLIREVARVGKRRGVDVSCCGEAAGDLEFALLLIGLGLRTLSATSASIPQLKRLVRSVTIHQCEKIARKALALALDGGGGGAGSDGGAGVARFLRENARQIIPEAYPGENGRGE
jgi:phosphoenolpyruvate-protein phosphotransferase (PTS system enzyme I)